MISLPESKWYKNAVIYAIDVKSFQDSNGDGIGDFRGLIDRLDYLQELGITCVWLLPFFPASDADNGYAVENYHAVDPRLGTLDDLIEFVYRAGERGIRVIIELVMNHTSVRHPWFEASRRARDSRYRGYYLWRDDPPVLSPDQGSAFPGTEVSAWSYDVLARAYYYHLFYQFQPDLNTSNPDVVDEILRLMDFWLAFGVAGFRLDAIGVMVEKRQSDPELEEDPIKILEDLRATLNRLRPDGVLLGEADVPAERLVSYFGSGGRLNMLLNFLLDQYLYLAFAQERAEPIVQVMDLLCPVPEDGQWVNFLRNLDELNIGKIPEGVRDDIYSAFGPDPEMRIYNRGIRRRVASMFGGDRRRTAMAFSLLFSLPGTPMFVYGDEIGMGEDLSLFERESVRTPMQWSVEANGGFSTAGPERLYRPVIADGPFGYPTVNVASQREDPGSLWQQMHELVLTRRRCPEIGLGSWEIIASPEPALFVHRCDTDEGTIFAVHNLARHPRTLLLEVSEAGEQGIQRLLGSAGSEVHGDSCRIQLDDYGFAWFRVDRRPGVKPRIRSLEWSTEEPTANGRVDGSLLDLPAIEAEAARSTGGQQKP